MDKLFKGLIVVLEPFDFKGDIEVMLLPLFDVLTTRTNQLVAVGASIDGVEDLFEGGATQSFLKFVEQHVQELLSVLLYRNIHGVSIRVLEGETELVRIVLLSLGQL